MAPSLSRREVLGSGVAAASVALAGCTNLFTDEQTVPGGLFVENQLEEDIAIVDLRLVEIREGSPNQTVVESRYRIPPQTALEFDIDLRPEAEYRLKARLVGERPQENEFTFTSGDCPEEEQRIDFSVIVDGDEIGLHEYRCNRAYKRREPLTYANASEYALGNETVQFANTTGTGNATDVGNATGTENESRYGSPPL